VRQTLGEEKARLVDKLSKSKR
jgi:chromosome segregation ATPase